MMQSPYLKAALKLLFVLLLFAGFGLEWWAYADGCMGDCVIPEPVEWEFCG